MCFPPFLNTFGVPRGAEVVLILWLFQPLTLTGLLTRLAAFLFSAVFLAAAVSRVGREKSVTILANAGGWSPCYLVTQYR